MRVFILAGGLGTRIRALFADRPKSMIPFNGKPFLEHQIALLAGQGFRRFVLCLSYQAEQIMAHFGDGERLGVEIVYSQETTPLGTGGALRYAERFFDDVALVINGDTYLATDYQALVAAHAQQPGAIGTIVVTEVADAGQSGQVILDEERRIIAFREKSANVGRGMVNAGVYVFAPRILDYIPTGEKVSLEREVFPALLDRGERLLGFPVRESFIDMGTPAGYQRLEEALR
ncbi:MAG TPA: nucleotidyltransferase family protein [Anaerolineae bacterium]|nr:nucleotidyltransferase family protein [Anaerolineae bacterium]HQI85463.1 nucleotidyltransferase family protein [Anaerolineae bacterium]